ncbi:MAG: DNA internalization-related competence protein ComEC/Rec2 [Clostridiales bacterium]|jgi:competence protein ComEC|nr:DNA internalization-related competence protein ComEC/Rec2 [Clostridiales bacterium]
MKRPLLLAVSALCAGILIGFYTQDGIWSAVFLVCVFISCFLFAGGAFDVKAGLKLAFVFALFSAVGLFGVRNNMGCADKNMALLAEKGESEAAFFAVVDEARKTDSGKYRLIIDIKKAIFNDKTSAVRNTRAVVYVDERCEPGREIVIKGAPEFLERARNPGGFDEFLYYKARGVEYKMFPEVLEKRKIRFSPFRAISQRLAGSFDAIFAEREASLMKAMIIGDKSELDDYISELYKRAGIYHIIALSGLHVSIIALAFAFVAGKFLSKRRATALTVAVLVFYGFLTGNSVSTVRAIIMYAVMAGGGLSFRKNDPASSAAFAMICVLVCKPLYLWDVGFQYSFSAVFGLIFCSSPIKNALLKFFNRSRGALLTTDTSPDERGKMKKFISEALASSVSATLATTPVLAWHFFYYLPYSPLINVVILPTVSVTTVFGFITGFVGLFSARAATVISVVPVITLKIYEWLSAFFTALPFSIVTTGRESIICAILWYAALMAATLALKNKDGKPRVAFFAFFIGFSLSFLKPFITPSDATVTMLDVGQGDCFVINIEKNAYVIDGGGLYGAKEGKNTGARTLAPYLSMTGVSTVEAAFVTHMDRDHAAGVIELLQLKKVKRLYVAKGAFDGSELSERLLAEARKNGSRISQIRAGDVLTLKNAEINCLYPFSGYGNDNESSLVLKLVYKNASFLFTGDIDKQCEREIIASGADISADVLKLAHHGSKYSSSEEFLNEVAPKIAIVSASKTNSYGHPNPETIARAESAGAAVYATPETGAVIIRVDDEKFKINASLRE